jgi:hypothetical protein
MRTVQFKHDIGDTVKVRDIGMAGGLTRSRSTATASSTGGLLERRQQEPGLDVRLGTGTGQPNERRIEMSGTQGRAGRRHAYRSGKPWAWLVANGWKNTRTGRGRRFRGRFLIHSAKGMTRAEYDACLLFVMSTGIRYGRRCRCLTARNYAEAASSARPSLWTASRNHGSEWFTGPYALCSTTPSRSRSRRAGGRSVFQSYNGPGETVTGWRWQRKRRRR